MIRFCLVSHADVVKLADTLGLGPSAEKRGGSSPSIGTIKKSLSSFSRRAFFIWQSRGLEREGAAAMGREAS